MWRVFLIWFGALGAAQAEAPRVVTDIAPVHGLVAEVMAGIAVPDLLLPPGTTPHDYALRPSNARAMQQANLVVWVGEDLTPWLGRSIENLAPDAKVVELLATDGTTLLPPRSEVSESEEEHAAHSDPHAWLDPENAKVWITAIGAALSDADPENAVAYRQNAAAAIVRIDDLIQEVEQALTTVRGRPYAVYHDSFQYFEHRFEMPARAALLEGEAAAPGAARVAAVRDLALGGELTCVFTEPQFNPSLAATVTEGSPARIATLDPLGSTLDLGAGYYGNMIEAIARGMVECLEKN